MAKFIRTAIDLGKNYFQLHALESEGGQSISRKVKRSKMHEVFSQIEPCRVGMEACGSAHYWARQLAAMGHEVVLIPPAYIKPYVKRGKNDVVDAAAICEAMSRPDMRFVPIKGADQQAVLMLHKTRELLVKQRTMAVNALRGHLAEFGIVAAKGIAASMNCWRWRRRMLHFRLLPWPRWPAWLNIWKGSTCRSRPWRKRSPGRTDKIRSAACSTRFPVLGR
jgi:transposase